MGQTGASGASALVRLEARVRRLERLVARQQPRIGLTIEEVREDLKKPLRLTPADRKQLRSIVGIGKSGIPDLSENFREYLRGKR